MTSPWALELATGGLGSAGASHVWRWVRKQVGAEWVLEPSFAGITVDANFHIHRTMFESKVLASSGQVAEAAEQFREAVKLDPSSQEAQKNLAAASR